MAHYTSKKDIFDMNRTLFARPALWWAVLAGTLTLMAIASLARAESGSGGVDAVLVMDSSGSMANTDPNQLRIPAAKLFMSLLGDKDRIGLVSFSDNGYPVLHLTAPAPATNAGILAAADKITSRGIYTNLYAGLEKGVEMLEKEGQEGQTKILVLMSDGRMDVGHSDEDWALTQQLRGALLDTIKAKRIKVYTIAFTEASDTALLKDIAKESGALFKLARRDADLHEVFGAIFESAKSPDMLPIVGGEFVVDASIEEVTIVASKEREDIRIYLQTPDGRRLAAEQAGDELKWFLSQYFDIITVRNPQPGAWKLLFSAGKNRAYIVTNMTLNHNPQVPSISAGSNMVLESWLEQEGKPLNREALLSNTRFRIKIEAPDGKSVDFDLLDTGQYGDRTVNDGIYSNTLSYDNAGSYKIDIIADGETFSRQKTVHFEVEPPPVESLALAVPPVAEPAAEPQPAEPEPAVADEAPEPPAAAAPAKKMRLNLGAAIGIFIAVNLVLGLVGFGAWWLVKKRKQKARAETEVEDNEEAENRAR
jgi:Mg-chelatase subunit ChlD